MQKLSHIRESGASLTVALRPGLLDRLLARVGARRLDRALAAGVNPEATPALALRARRLTDSNHRRSMADGYRRLQRKAPRRLDVAGVDLGELAETLAGPGPVSATGAAQAWLLLTDGTGPLYDSRDAVGLRCSAAQTRDSLELEPIA